MKDRERLKKIDDLLESYYASEDGFEQIDLAISIIQGHVNWLKQQAEEKQELEEELEEIKGMYVNTRKLWLEEKHQNKQYEETIKSHAPHGRNYTNGQYVGLLHENRRLRENLEFYANPHHYDYGYGQVDTDQGEKARQALQNNREG